jgi:hypothetical protein
LEYPSDPRATREQQYEFLRTELAGGDSGAVQAEREMRERGTRACEAGAIFSEKFERHSNRSTADGRKAAQNEDDRRGNLAQGLLDTYHRRARRPTAPIESELPQAPYALPSRRNLSSLRAGTVNVTVTLAGAVPPGTRVATTQSGSARVSPPRVVPRSRQWARRPRAAGPATRRASPRRGRAGRSGRWHACRGPRARPTNRRR